MQHIEYTLSIIKKPDTGIVGTDCGVGFVNTAITHIQLAMRVANTYVQYKPRNGSYTSVKRKEAQVWRAVELIAEMMTGWHSEVAFLDYDSGHCSGGGAGIRRERRNECCSLQGTVLRTTGRTTHSQERAETCFNVQACRSKPLVALASAKEITE